jgi:ElaB/YqjD/DUF883 family membrane-anchored ribosome-binding protein
MVEISCKTDITIPNTTATMTQHLYRNSLERKCYGSNNPFGGSLTGSTRANPNTNPVSANPASAKLEDAAQIAHQATDKIADRATAQVDRLTATAHRVVNSAADAVSSAAEWASAIPEQAKQIHAQFTETANASIRARPIATVAGALVIGYLLGRLGGR